MREGIVAEPLVVAPAGPLIATPQQSRWHQDVAVAELIAHFNQPDKFEQWDRLTASEIRTIMKEVQKCRDDFVYAARNYFWITTKERVDRLFSLWPGQELILQKILELKAKGLQQKIIIIKARQLGCSTLIEALIAWRVMFFSGVNALVVSYDRDHTSDVLFPIMLFVYDRMPWWLRPECAQRKADTGLFFENPDFARRGLDPGINSRVYVKGANSTTAVGMGIRLSAAHISEFASFDDRVAKEIIDQDMVHALAPGPDTFAILESTAKGANRYGHKLWKKCVEMAEESDWYPLFLPAFFEDHRVRVPVAGYKPEKEEHRKREQVAAYWVRCDNPLCLQYHYRFLKGEDRSETTCVTCGKGKIYPYLLTDGQMAYMEHLRKNATRDDDSIKKLLQELCLTPEEAFQIEGYQVFGQRAQDFANSCVRPPIAMGDFDNAGRFHGCNTHKEKLVDPTTGHDYFPCYQEDCTEDHSWDDTPLLVWEFPRPGADYCVGADVAEGLGGRAAYSVGSAIRFSNSGGGDYQVATWRSNIIDVIGFAHKLNFLGLWYNSALMAVECNKYDLCIGHMRFQLQYPNTYRWKHLDAMNIMSNKLGWWTNSSSRPRLWQTYKRWLQQELFFVRSHNLAEEMKNFVKDDDDDRDAGADKDEYDDELIATMIALYTAHEADWNDNLGMVQPRHELTMESARFHMHCRNCDQRWPTNVVDDKSWDPTEFKPVLDNDKKVVASGGIICPTCGSRIVEIHRNIDGPGWTSEEYLVREATMDWSPDKEFNSAKMDYDQL